MPRFWISWEEPGDDPRPLTVPSPIWWCTGWGDDYATVCAVVDAKSEDAAREQVESQWQPQSFRFVTAVDEGWMPPPDRFPRYDLEAN